MPVKTIIVVRGGMVTDVYSTLQSKEHEVELLDLDGAESYETKEKLESRVIKVANAKKYHSIY